MNYANKYIFENNEMLSYFGDNLYAVDGSRLRLNKSLEIAGYSKNTGGFYSEGLITGIYNCNNNIPEILYMSNDKNERKGLLANIKDIPKGGILVADRGYFSNEILKTTKDNGLNGIFRIKINQSAILEKAYKKKFKDQYLSINNYNVRLIKYTVSKGNRKNPIIMIIIYHLNILS